MNLKPYAFLGNVKLQQRKNLVGLAPGLVKITLKFMRKAKKICGCLPGQASALDCWF